MKPEGDQRSLLCVDALTAGWCEVWSDASASLAGRHFRLVFRSDAARHEPQTGEAQ